MLDREGKAGHGTKAVKESKGVIRDGKAGQGGKCTAKTKCRKFETNIPR